MDKVFVKREKQDGYAVFRIPGIICTESGTLLAYYESRKAWHDRAPMDIGLKISKDEGKTWSDDVILVHGQGKTVNNPVMFAGHGEILFMWQEEYYNTFYRKSFDDGESWSDPVEVTDFLKYPEYEYIVIACGPGHGTVLSNGRYIVPVWLSKDDVIAHPSVISTIYSDDKGVTWHTGQIIEMDDVVDPNETSLAELEDGSIMLNIRNESPVKRRAIAYSENGADGWYDIQFASDLADPICMGGMAGYNGKVYFVNCNSVDKRENLTLYEAMDKGKTWKKLSLISETGGYADVAIAPNGRKIYVLFEDFHYRKSDALFKPFDEEKGNNLAFVSLDLVTE